METNKKKLMSAALASNARAHASDDDVDPLQNSNLKWFESAIANIQVVENMTKQLHEQERAGQQNIIEKKDGIIKQANEQNEDYMRQIAELDRQIAETQQDELNVRQAIADEKKQTKETIEVLNS